MRTAEISYGWLRYQMSTQSAAQTVNKKKQPRSLCDKKSRKFEW